MNAQHSLFEEENTLNINCLIHWSIVKSTQLRSRTLGEFAFFKFLKNIAFLYFNFINSSMLCKDFLFIIGSPKLFDTFGQLFQLNCYRQISWLCSSVSQSLVRIILSQFSPRKLIGSLFLQSLLSYLGSLRQGVDHKILQSKKLSISYSYSFVSAFCTYFIYYQLEICGMLLKNTPSSQQPAHQIQQHFHNNVKPIFAKLMAALYKSKPQDILDFCTKWFRDRKGEKDKDRFQDEQSASSEEDEDSKFYVISDEQFKAWRANRLQRGRKKRVGLSSEKVFRGSIKVQRGQKKQQNTEMRILFFCMNSFLFKNFSEKQVCQLIEMMKKEKVQRNKEIFKEGEYGDRMYFVDQGIFQCVKKTDKGVKTVKNYYVGDTFGEICLLHMVKRQATIYSRSEGILYSLDRQSYIHFKKMCMIKKRTLYLCTLLKQPLFSTFQQQKLQKICDVLSEVQFQEGEIVINQGDVGSKFYIIIQGILVAYKGSCDNIVQCYKEGDAFGQVALIKDTPRQASVKTLTRCKMVYITRQIFRRIFENMHTLQREIDQKYNNKVNLGLKRKEGSEEEKQKGKGGQNRRQSINQNLKIPILSPK